MLLLQCRPTQSWCAMARIKRGKATALNEALKLYLTEHVPIKQRYIDTSNCQSRLDGRFMSHACTVNSSLRCKAVLVSEIQVEEKLLAFLTSSLEEQFINLMRKGIIMRYEVFAPKGSPFLSAFDVVMAMDLHLAIPRHGELGFTPQKRLKRKLLNT